MVPLAGLFGMLVAAGGGLVLGYFCEHDRPGFFALVLGLFLGNGVSLTGLVIAGCWIFDRLDATGRQHKGGA